MVAKFATNARGAMLLLNLIQVTESISGSVVPLAMLLYGIGQGKIPSRILLQVYNEKNVTKEKKLNSNFTINEDISDIIGYMLQER